MRRADVIQIQNEQALVRDSGIGFHFLIVHNSAIFFTASRL